MLVHALVLGAIAIFINYRWVKFSPVIFLITLVLASSSLNTVYNEFLGLIILKEQGQNYFYYAHAEVLAVLFANIIGIYFGIRRYKILNKQQHSQYSA